MIYDTMKERKIYMIIYEPNIVEYHLFISFFLFFFLVSLLDVCK